MKIIVRFTPARWDDYSGYLMPKLPGAIPIVDDGRGAMQTYLQALEEAGESPALILEDDIILTRKFLPKVQQAIRQHPDMTIQFFSRSTHDNKLGSRRKPGSSYMMGQCTFFPAGLCTHLREFYETWDRKAENPTGTDVMVAHFLAAYRLGYWLHVPSLVDHRVCVSAINPKRSSKRQSTTFFDPDPEGLQ